MRILFTRFPLESIPDGGAERQVIALARGLAARGHEVSFVGSCPALLDAFRDAKLPASELTIGPPPVSKAAIARFVLGKKRMKKKLETMLAERKKTDAVVMLSLSEKLLLTDIAAKNAEVIWIEHDPVGRWLTKNPWLKLLKEQSAKATTVTVSKLSRDQYLDMDWNPKKAVTIENGIDDAWFADGKKRAAGDTLRLGYVGRLAEEKGVDLLLRAMADLPRATLDIAGDGPEESALKKRADKLGLGHRVRFLGRVKDVASIYRQIDGLVLPSRTVDPFGMVVAEAMATGVPCVVTDACGIAPCVEAAGHGLVVRRDSAAAIVKGVQALREALNDPSMKERLRTIAKQHFSVSTMVERYERLFTGKPAQ